MENLPPETYTPSYFLAFIIVGASGVIILLVTRRWWSWRHAGIGYYSLFVTVLLIFIGGFGLLQGAKAYEIREITGQVSYKVTDLVSTSSYSAPEKVYAIFINYERERFFVSKEIYNWLIVGETVKLEYQDKTRVGSREHRVIRVDKVE
jgi:hypothetical protein